jgi:excisionase family DNA binding protein
VRTVVARRPVERPIADAYLTLPEVGERLGTGVRFARRLIEERRIEYKKFGHHVRVAESVLNAYIASCTVEPVKRKCRTAGKRSQ